MREVLFSAGFLRVAAYESMWWVRKLSRRAVWLAGQKERMRERSSGEGELFVGRGGGDTAVEQGGVLLGEGRGDFGGWGDGGEEVGEGFDLGEPGAVVGGEDFHGAAAAGAHGAGFDDGLVVVDGDFWPWDFRTNWMSRRSSSTSYPSSWRSCARRRSWP